MICPKCKEDRLHRSHRKGMWEHTASLLGYYPHRCRACSHRFLMFKYGGREQRLSGTEREIRATRGAIRWKRKKQELTLYAVCFLIFLALLAIILSNNRLS